MAECEIASQREAAASALGLLSIPVGFIGCIFPFSVCVLLGSDNAKSLCAFLICSLANVFQIEGTL